MILDTSAITPRQRYELLTSLVVPRPVAWVSTRSAEGRPNLAPFSYFSALSPTPFLVGVSIGHRRNGPKDSLRNILETGAFCVNVATEGQLAAMNHTSGEYPPETDEFAHAGVPMAWAESVGAPYVANAPAVLECRLFKHVELEGAANTLVIGEVLRVRISDALPLADGTMFVDTHALAPVARLWGDFYALIGDTPSTPRPPADAPPLAPGDSQHLQSPARRA
ncbi:flavin reductase family protein [Longimicrobium sp.]|uniref:flavin reductase family protein n=1 Tax=Longimicrobium sp. TaxID=2029185 RepID=UPI002D1AF35D|nr:flavin reductase family protein [Longimicrobium sp.]HSU14615.1 flavin reductase family protein [Longimicrobium sp.]